MKVIIKLSGADVLEVIGDGVTIDKPPINHEDYLEVEIRQYHREFQDPDTFKHSEYHLPNLKYEVVNWG